MMGLSEGTRRRIRERFEHVDQAAKERMWKKFVKGGRKDDELRRYLIELEVPTLRRMAHALMGTLPATVDLEELVQEGFFGLHQASLTYDPGRNVRFWTHAGYRVRGAMLDFLRSIDHVPRLARQRQKLRKQFEDRWVQEYGTRPTEQQIIAGLGWTKEKFADSEPWQHESLSKPAFESEMTGRLTALHELLACTSEKPHEPLARQDEFRHLVRGLDMDMMVMMWLYYARGATMKKIGEAFDLSESRVSQMFSMALAQLVERMRRHERAA